MKQLERDAILGVTSGHDWDVIVGYLINEVNAAHQQMLVAPSWDAINSIRGYMQGVSFVLNLRDTVKKVIENEREEAEFNANI